MVEVPDNATLLGLISQDEISEAQTIFSDGLIGIATANGVARITFATVKFAITPDAKYPTPAPVLTLLLPETSALRMARELAARAEKLGITLDNDDDAVER